MGMTKEEIVAEYKRRNPYDCFVMAVEHSIETIVDTIFDIMEGKPPTDSEQEDIDDVSSTHNLV
jgi:hypothetical protein